MGTIDLTRYWRGEWDDHNRRPSHADKRKSLRLALCIENFSASLAEEQNPKLLKILEQYQYFMTGC